MSTQNDDGSTNSDNESKRSLGDNSNERHIADLKRKRTGKKISVTKRINQIRKLIGEFGSRTQIKAYLDVLLSVESEVAITHENLMAAINIADTNYSDQWLEDVVFQIEECRIEVAVYLKTREEEAPSEISRAPSRIASQSGNSRREAIPKVDNVIAGSINESRRDAVLRVEQITHHNEVKKEKKGNSYTHSWLQKLPAPYDDNQQNQRLERKGRQVNLQQVEGNDIDSWIDELDELSISRLNITVASDPNDAMHWLIQQQLPRVEIPSFDGSPINWVSFIIRFRDLVHLQPHLNETQRLNYLVQCLRNDAKRSIQGYLNTRGGYVVALKRLKFLFGQRSNVVAAHLAKVTKGKLISNDDQFGLTTLYYSLSDCLVTLKQLNYHADINSSDILRQIFRRVPVRLHTSWAERCLKIRKHSEPNLEDLEEWLQNRVLAMKESCLPERASRRSSPDRNKANNDKWSGFTKGGENQTPSGSRYSDSKRERIKPKGDSKCQQCSGYHKIYKCDNFNKLDEREKFQLVKSLKLCFNCLRQDHFTSKCTSSNTCFKDGCKKKHHTSLHNYFNKRHTDTTASKEKEDDKNHVGMVSRQSTDVLLPIVPVILRHNNNQSTKTLAVLDTGSQCTLIREDIAKLLNLKGRNATIKISTVNDPGSNIKTRCAPIKIEAVDGSQSLCSKGAYVIPTTKFYLPQQLTADVINNLSYSSKLDLQNHESLDVTMLIGADVPKAFIQTDFILGQVDEPIAIKTPFGWALLGPACNDIAVESERRIVVNKIEVDECDEKLHNLIEQFWKTESFSTGDCFKLGHSSNDKKCLEILEKKTFKENGHYVVPMLWKDNELTLPNNYEMAKKRFQFLQKRLSRQPELKEKYVAAINTYIEKGYAKKVTKEEIYQSNKRTWYLPHHPVTNPNKPGKVRVVFDAASHYKGKSLNESLYSGPDLLNNLVGVLLRFRVRPVALTADVEAMFSQVKVTSEDTNSLRFLWNENPTSNSQPDTFKMMVHIFGATCSPSCCNYVIKRIAREESDQYSAMCIETLLKSFYADDLLKSLQTENEAILLSKELSKILSLGGFRLSKYFSNSQRVMEQIPQEDRAKSKCDKTFEDKNIERTLGIHWNTINDSFIFKSNIKVSPFTKRGIVSTTSSIFDPLGFVTPFILKAKLLIQDMWREKILWDEPISESQHKEWQSWLHETSNLSNFSMRRLYYDKENPIPNDIELHIFSDASELAYGAVAYIRFVKKNEVTCSLVMSKSRLAPIKVITLPRLELNAAVVGARLGQFIVDEIDLPITRISYWTDSMLVLQYIKNTQQRFKTFVANRVSEIHQCSTIDQWNHIPGTKNPADICSRGVSSIGELSKDDGLKSWFKGPEFLWKTDENWDALLSVPNLSMADLEIKQESHTCMMNTMYPDITERYSCWMRLRKIIGWIFRFINNCRASVLKKVGYSEANLSLHDLKKAESSIIKLVQMKHFNKDHSNLKNKDVVNIRSNLAQLSPFLDKDEVLRANGRFENDTEGVVNKYPIILPPNDHVVNLIIINTHINQAHAGTEHTLAVLRETYWITIERKAVKTMIKSCLTCKKKHAKQLTPFMASLPAYRLEVGLPVFSNTGVDYFGPLEIKQGRKRLKRWGCLFTCLNTRAVHLEIAESLETDSFLNCLMRFTSRRGTPKLIVSDCGTNFKGASKEIKENLKHFNQSQLNVYSLKKGFQWQFNPPSSPHMGGIWERMVRTVKSSLYTVMNKVVLTEFQLQTLIIEVENIVNSRPLTYVSEDVNDLHAITPNHFLRGNSIYRHEIFSAENISHRKRWRQVQMLSDHYWRRWVKEYLPTLLTRKKWHDRKNMNLPIGSLVLVNDGIHDKYSWPLARITKCMPGKDGISRVYEIKTKSGMYVRPAAKIYPLEEETYYEVPQGGRDVTVESD